LCTPTVGARNIVKARSCYGTYILCTLYCLLTSCFSLSDCCLIFCYFMLCLHSLLVLIYLLLHVYFGCCLTVFLWLIISHKSYPDLRLNPSRVSVKLSRTTLGFPSRYPSPLLGGLRDTWVQCVLCVFISSSSCTMCYISVYQCGLWSIVQVCLCGDWRCVLTWLLAVPKTCRVKNTSKKLPCCIKLAFPISS
jgi:hypothetical protein